MAALTKVGWLAYVVAFFAAHSGLSSLGGVALLAGMVCRWRFWRWALPLGLITAVSVGDDDRRRALLNSLKELAQLRLISRA